MQAHIAREYARLERIEREAENERAYQADLADDARRAEENAYIARVKDALRAGMSEEEFELREAAAISAGYRITENANNEILRIFAASAPRERRAA